MEIIFNIKNKQIVSPLSKEEIEEIFSKEDFDSYRFVKPIVIKDKNVRSEYYDLDKTETTINRV